MQEKYHSEATSAIIGRVKLDPIVNALPTAFFMERFRIHGFESQPSASWVRGVVVLRR